MTRACGGCTLCCRLMPVRELAKGANTRCRYQRTGKGCAVYATHKQPPSCKIWSCAWLVDPETAKLSRPDRSHYVIDVMPDYITTVDNATGERRDHPVVQVWCDPKHRDAHRDPALREWLGDRLALIRYSTNDAILIGKQEDGEWHERASMSMRAQHTPDEIARVCA